MKPDPTISIFGTGALGSALLNYFQHSGKRVQSTWNSKGGSVFSRRSGSLESVGYAFPSGVSEVGDWIFITTPDDIIAKISEKLLILKPDWNGHSVIHCSGGLTSAKLEVMNNAGAYTASMHPIQTFRRGDTRSRFQDIYISTEGSEDIKTDLENMIIDMGAHPLRLSAEQKKIVHIAAVFASNYLVALLGMADEYLKEDGIEDGLEILRPLIHQTILNIEQKGIFEALSGPVARGDEETINSHLSALEGKSELDFYKLLGGQAIRIAEEGHQIDEEESDRLRKLFSQH